MRHINPNIHNKTELSLENNSKNNILQEQK